MITLNNRTIILVASLGAVLQLCMYTFLWPAGLGPCTSAQEGERRHDIPRNLHSGQHANQIPRILHYLWPNKDFSFGDEDPDGKMQGDLQKRVQRIATSNQGWELKIWTDNDCHALMWKHFPDFYPHWIKLTPQLKMWDSVRPAILFVHGGIYLDHDIECDQGVSFAQWISPETSLLLPESSHLRGLMSNFFMGSAPKHPIWKLYLENIVKEFPKKYPVARHTGPKQLANTFQMFSMNATVENRAQTRLLQLNEVAKGGSCEEYAVYKDYCAQPKCIHRASASPAELAGEDDDADNEVNLFRQKLAKRERQKNPVKSFEKDFYESSQKCACRRLKLVQLRSSVFDDDTEVRPPVFVHIPKTGGTTMEFLLHFDASCHATAAEIKACDVNYYTKSLTFTIIRNPIERAVSMYRYAVTGGNGHDSDDEKFGWAKDLDFAGFVKALPKQQKVSYAPQIHFVEDYETSAIIVDEILCTEDLASGWRRLKKLLPSLKYYGELPSKRFRTSSSAIFSADQVDGATEHKLREMYKDDFELWERYCNKSSA